MEPSQDHLAALYEPLLLIRRVEEEIVRLYPSDKIKSPVHLSIGQEWVSVGVCRHLRNQDVVFGTYRGHALYLAKGGDLDRMMAELFGKSGGSGRGRAGSMHLHDRDVNMIGTSAIVATSISQAVGWAFAVKSRKQDAIIISFFGEGATDEGAFHEAVNFAALKSLPILFVCENNLFAIYSHVKDRMAGGDLCARVRTYGIPAARIDSGDVFELERTAGESIDAVRAGAGPRFLECMTYRWRDHVGPDEDRIHRYRPDGELDSWIAADQVRRLAAMLTADRRSAIDAAVEARIAKAVEFAESSPFPAAEEVFEHVFAS